MRAARLVLSCEHAGKNVPEACAYAFETAEARAALESHRGWDPGSLEVARGMMASLEETEVFLVVQPVSRLVVECNRSLDHPRLFSEVTRHLPEEERVELVERIWRPHRERVRGLVVGWRAGEGSAGGTMHASGEIRDRAGSEDPDVPVLHVGVHTFTPVWGGRPRSTDIGFLYDPAREAEARLARTWRAEVAGSAGVRGLNLHLNRPYRGWTDGLTTALRRELPESAYLGLEVEVSQRLEHRAAEIGRVLGAALGAVMPIGGVGPTDVTGDA